MELGIGLRHRGDGSTAAVDRHHCDVAALLILKGAAWRDDRANGHNNMRDCRTSSWRCLPDIHFQVDSLLMLQQYQ